MIANSSGTTFRLPKSTFFLMVASLLIWNMVAAPGAASQTSHLQASARKLRASAPPEYPEIARKMNIQGLTRVLLTVNSDGKVVDVKELGGNPILLAALVQAVKKWKYEPADRESAIEVRYEFVTGR